MKQRTLGYFFLSVGLACAVSYILFGSRMPLGAEIGFKIAPTAVMCAWMLVKKVDRTDVFILIGLVFSMLCDFFMALPDAGRYTLFGMASNALGLVFYTAYFVRSDPSLDMPRLLPPAFLLAVFFWIISPNLGDNRWPTLGYCALYAVFLWRAAARIGDPDIDRGAQIASYAGSMALAISDCVLALTVFGLVGAHPVLHGAVMVLWWTGLVLLMVTADIKTEAAAKKSGSGSAPGVPGAAG